MKFLYALAAFAAVAVAIESDIDDDGVLYDEDFLIPGEIDAIPDGVGPFKKHGPPKGGPTPFGKPLFHPPHFGFIIDGCDSDEHDKWHWAKPAKPPGSGGNKWTTSTVTKTSTKTVIGCPKTVVSCPAADKTKTTTVIIPVTTTICPVPISNGPPPPPPKTTSHPPPPTKAAPPPPPPTKVPPPPTTMAPPPPPPTKAPTISLGTVTKPAPTPTTSRAVVTAAAVPNAQRAGGALVAVAVAAIALI